MLFQFGSIQSHLKNQKFEVYPPYNKSMFADRPSHTILKADGKFEMVEDFYTHI